MSNTPHELAEEFPEYADRISALKLSDAHFAKLFESYHAINRSIHRAETDVEPVGDLAMVDMRKERGALRDALYRLLRG